MTEVPNSDFHADTPFPPHAPVYLDFNATSPVDPRVAEEVMTYMAHEFGNAGSRTHSYGQRAKERVKQARAEVAAVVAAQVDEVFFTSGATESNNLAILGMAAHGEDTGKRHIISTQIEHKAVLEPLEVLQARGFDVELLPPTDGGWVSPEAVAAALRPDTLLVSVMAVNNETGVIQPLHEIAEVLSGHDAYFHVDAAQAFGKLIEPLRNARIDLLAVSGHKIGGPKGIGALICRRRGYTRAPLKPLMFGGGQERGLRPGTLPVALIAGMGTASALALNETEDRLRVAMEIKEKLLAALAPLGVELNGDVHRTVASTLNVSIPGVDSEAAIVALKDVVALSNGSACTSQAYEPSHVLTAAGFPQSRVEGALRLSWGPGTTQVPYEEIARRLRGLQKR
ncbi:cysteine desulfurase DndA [Arthrobacter sp. StoSoilB13]|uniref:cysteine desulfurase DndA n=1 Tax=Arthrobacter sp. StoSoilB13 TaxID=2830993 RepID=UPI001CC6452A|nr:cysteine desulfurase DndA [Arthrobacter sp. StoSoilB13]BCW52044.1 putative L-cysteine desulfurase [Arthrobacter sp. StoSoilB13]